MARITVEDYLKKVENQFKLVHLAARRAKMLHVGAKPVVETDNKEIVTALREIAAGKVYLMEPDGEDPQSSNESITQSEGEGVEDVSSSGS